MDPTVDVYFYEPGIAVVIRYTRIRLYYGTPDVSSWLSSRISNFWGAVP